MSSSLRLSNDWLGQTFEVVQDQSCSTCEELPLETEDEQSNFPDGCGTMSTFCFRSPVARAREMSVCLSSSKANSAFIIRLVWCRFVTEIVKVFCPCVPNSIDRLSLDNRAYHPEERERPFVVEHRTCSSRCTSHSSGLLLWQVDSSRPLSWCHSERNACLSFRLQYRSESIDGPNQTLVLCRIQCMSLGTARKENEILAKANACTNTLQHLKRIVSTPTAQHRHR